MTMTNTIQKAAAQQKAVASAENRGKQTLQAYIKQMEPAIKAALPSVLTPERFTRIVLSALSTNKKLVKCEPSTFLGAMMTAAQLGIEPNTPLGQGYLIPRWNGNTNRNECTFQLGYKGLIDLAYRSGQVSTISAETVYANDTFSYELGLEPKLIHKPAMQDRGEPVAFYAVVRLKDGGYGFKVMSVADAREHANKYSDAVKRGGTSPWTTNFDEMAKKTVLKQALKLMPMKTDFVRAVQQDETIHDTIEDDMTLAPVVQVESEIVDTDTGEIINANEATSSENPAEQPAG